MLHRPGWAGARDVRQGPAWARPGLAKLQKNIQHENEHILIIRTPFSMFLGSLESQRKALQEYTEKHHNTTSENKTKCGKVKHSLATRKCYIFCKWSPNEVKPIFWKEDNKWNPWKYWKKVKDILQIIGRVRPSTRMNRQNFQYRKRNRRRIWKPYSMNLSLS